MSLFFSDLWGILGKVAGSCEAEYQREERDPEVCMSLLPDNKLYVHIEFTKLHKELELEKE